MRTSFGRERRAFTESSNQAPRQPFILNLVVQYAKRHGLGRFGQQPNLYRSTFITHSKTGTRPVRSKSASPSIPSVSSPASSSPRHWCAPAWSRPGAKLAYGRLARYGSRDGRCLPDVGTLAREFGVGPRQAQRYLTAYGPKTQTYGPGET
jgi:hypothetical protein